MSYIGSGAAPKATALDNDTVETTDIKDGAVTAGKMATGAAASNLGSYVSSVNGQSGAATLTKTDVGLANVANVDQTNASNLTSGTVVTARLGSGTANSTTYLRGDQTWATVSGGVTSLNGQTGAITNTDLNAIGSYIIGRPQNATGYQRNSTIAGSSLYSTSSGGYWDSVDALWRSTVNTPFSTNGPSLVNTGTWRAMTAAGQASSLNFSGLWVRIS